jgi:hypothetical protein
LQSCDLDMLHRQLDLFSALQSSTEGIDTESKSARGGVANTQGGTIVLGVTERPAGLVWEGVPDAAQLRAFSKLPFVRL